MAHKIHRRSSVNEVTGNSDAVRSLRLYGFRAYKIPDVRGTKFTGEKPCDIWAYSNKGRHVSIEGKMIKKFESFSSKVLRSNQIEELDACVQKEGRAFVFLYIYIPRQKKQLVVFDWLLYRDLLHRGFSKQELLTKEFGVWLEEMKQFDGKAIFNLSKLLSKEFK